MRPGTPGDEGREGPSVRIPRVLLALGGGWSTKLYTLADEPTTLRGLDGCEEVETVLVAGDLARGVVALSGVDARKEVLAGEGGERGESMVEGFF